MWPNWTATSIWVTLSLTAIFIISIARLGREWWPHHFYYGAALAVIAIVLASPSLFILATIVMLDDSGQHFWQMLHHHSGDPKLTGADDRSPLHRGFYWLVNKL